MLVTKRGRRALVISGHRLTPPYEAPSPSATTTNGWLGTDEATVDSSKHVNGGCRAERDRNLMGLLHRRRRGPPEDHLRAFLGQYAPVPGVG